MTSSVTTRLLSNAVTAERRLMQLKKELETLREIKIQERIAKLLEENTILRLQVTKAKELLIKLEMANGKKQYDVPHKGAITNPTACSENKEIKKAPALQTSVEPKEKPSKSKGSKEKSASTVQSETIDVRKLDFKIGKIVDVKKHPDADSLYVEQIDCGEENPRTVVSGLVNHVPIDQMTERMVMVLCNLKPVKMRGVLSEAMVMCASTAEKVEILIPPPNAVPGDLVYCKGFPREPEAQLNPKKKIFETCAPDLKTNDDAIACYKGSPLEIEGKGPIRAPTLKGVNVK